MFVFAIYWCYKGICDFFNLKYFRSTYNKWKDYPDLQKKWRRRFSFGEFALIPGFLYVFWRDSITRNYITVREMLLVFLLPVLYVITVRIFMEREIRRLP